MTRTKMVHGSLGILGLAALAIPVAGSATTTPPPPPSPLPMVKQDANQNRAFYATTDDNQLLSFSARSPQNAAARKITGLPAGVTLVGVDTQPASGDLYGVGSDNVVYEINTATAIAKSEGRPPFTPALSGRFFGVDFNPVVDRIRVVGDDNQNLALHPDTGAATANAAINPGERDVVASAYVNSSYVAFNSAGKATATVLYAIDSGDDQLCQQSPPAAGTLVACKDISPGLVNPRGNTAFDIVGDTRVVNGMTSDTNVGYITTKDPILAGYTLYRIDLGSAGTQRMGRILTNNGQTTPTVVGLAAVQDER